ncbi:MAG: ferrous iron transport protein B [Flavobacteriales bacterium]
MNKLKVALIGNPNVGKTTLFNRLCGVNQKTGNYPGVTVDKKIGKFKHLDYQIEVTDLPGFDSIYPKSLDEELVVDFLKNNSGENKVDKVVFVADGTNIKKNLYLLSQIKDLGYDIVLAINLIDIAKRKGIIINTEYLSKEFGIHVVNISARKGEGLDELKTALFLETPEAKADDLKYLKVENRAVLEEFVIKNGSSNSYKSFLSITQENALPEINIKKWKTEEAILRYQYVRKVMENSISTDKSLATDLSSRLDKVLMHKVWGYLIFLGVLLVIFQSVFSLAQIPMEWIGTLFSWLSDSAKSGLSEGSFTNFITGGLIPGLEGVVIFIPQIVILFFFFALLDESGYMNRIIFLMDRLMQKVGMSGKSVVPLISSFACAVPAIMATRTIENKRERLITILVAPLLTCSARLPVYTILIGLLVPNDEYVGFISVQALVLLGMYLLGLVTSALAALVFKYIIKNKYRSFFITEMPRYLVPNFKNVLFTIWENTKAFVWNAGKIIVAASIILYVLGANGGEKFDKAEETVTAQYSSLKGKELSDQIKTYRMENSYLGMMGKSIEPAIEPLGYDWKVGIALISSIAAREVFVGTISIIYSINSDEDLTIMQKLDKEINANTGKRTFNFATCISLLLFYAFSLQCMSTIAVTYKETKSLKWTTIQFLYMTILAYVVSLIAYQILS